MTDKPENLNSSLAENSILNTQTYSATVPFAPKELPEFIAHAGNPLPKGSTPVAKEMIIFALKTVSDPEIMINIWDMGLVYKIEQFDEGKVYIEMTVTSPMCPVAGILPQQAADAVAQVKGVGQVEVKVVWEPAWSLEMLSDEAKAMLEFF